MMTAPPDPTVSPPDPTVSRTGDKRCKACGRWVSEHTESELKNCENFNYHMENKK